VRDEPLRGGIHARDAAHGGAGGPGNATTFLSQTLTQMAIGQFDLGPAAAFSLVYFLIILLVSWLFYTAMTHNDKTR
jgi:glycerol transport system permease protein